MALERVGGRPSRSREDAQIDTQSFLLREGVQFWMVGPIWQFWRC